MSGSDGAREEIRGPVVEFPNIEYGREGIAGLDG